MILSNGTVTACFRRLLYRFDTVRIVLLDRCHRIKRTAFQARDFVVAAEVSVHKVIPPGQTVDTSNVPLIDESQAPLFSIVVPVYNHWEITLRCLDAVAGVPTRCKFELIVVDDGSIDATAMSLSGCSAIRVHRMASNSGFVAACNAGAALARGTYVVFLNNDTEVTAGWLDALHDTFLTHARCGMVGAKLIYPDGRLQEAGGVVFANGHAANYGRDGDPHDRRYTFLRPVDYCSGACIALPVALFRQLGGLDSRYAPAYYEDTDLAFAVRAAGFDVLYQPLAQVVHFEGKTAGTDTRSGTKRYQEINREKFVAKWRDALSAQHDRQAYDALPESCATRSRGKRVLVVDTHYPRPDRDSGSLRMFGMLTILCELGHRVLFFAAEGQADDDYARALEQMGVELVDAPSPLQALRWWYAHGQSIDTVILSRLPVAERFMPFARRYAPDAAVIFDTVDLHFLRIERGGVLHGDRRAVQASKAMKRNELRLMREADLALVVSAYEQAVIQRIAPDITLSVLSNIHDVHGRQAAFGDREGLLFLGNFQHEPNVDAIRYFAKEVMPYLRTQLPGVSLHVVGHAGSAVLADLAAHDIHIDDYVPDLGPVLRRARVALAPLRYGAGVKGKINMAMSYGVPVVTTSVGAEGMGLIDRQDVMIADDPQVFAAAVAEVYRGETLWMTLSDNGIENVRSNFSVESARRAIEAAMATAR